MVRLTALKPDNTGIHRFHNLAEDVWREFRDDSRVETETLKFTMDVACFEIGLVTRPALAKRVANSVKNLARIHLEPNEYEVQVIVL